MAVLVVILALPMGSAATRAGQEMANWANSANWGAHFNKQVLQRKKALAVEADARGG